ncbi:hypothetical protein SAMN05661008_00851 [Alkalithermobacter thermoalcaliphilus JW-YL-7 = DSM 7308]|uniref:Glycosyltransferase n=1 Tax=Alkalithermobacter thermoalcaliphilus JW-YL-7 = DSM 7308 TaxID=1121328 RepID=A0A150FQP0_CLOPD|nr:Protein of unknown function DUF2064 [[Clostridium] paradoxum JW-YL-7 = DSM 7308]SHK77004.1 hypothetical protein SAMN05661008_00851 [[Clostridium] paradoxum JW-YL-7 = DSM 7308]
MKALILMTRVPIPGKTKTRLMEILSANECAQIHTNFLLDIFNVLHTLKEDIDIYLSYTPKEEFDLMKHIVPKYINTFPQRGDTLGDKMANSIEYLLNKGYSKVVLIGSDIPDIKDTDIKNAFDILNTKDVVIGPTYDGGYYLIGMKKIYRSIFSDDIKWGYKTVLEGTLDILNKLNINVGINTKLKDIDTKEDLIDFFERMNQHDDKNILPKNTINFLKKYWSDNWDVKRYIK